MKNYKITSIQLIKYQQVLDKVYGKGKFIAGCIMLLFALSFFTSCVSEAKIPLPVGSQERTPQDMQRRPNPPVAITITDTTQQNIFDENPLIKTNHPIVFDAYFAQERDGAYHRIDKSCIGNTVFVVVDTLNLVGEQIDIRIRDGNGIITNNLPFQQYVNTNADGTTQEVFQNTYLLGKSLPCANFERKEYVWDTDYADGNWYLIRGGKLNHGNNDINQLILAWNAAYPVQIKLSGAEDKTAIVNIVKDNNFAQSYGSTGAIRVLASLVYTLTEDCRYKNIRLNFKEGEHASPGIYARADFLDSFYVCY